MTDKQIFQKASKIVNDTFAQLGIKKENLDIRVWCWYVAKEQSKIMEEQKCLI